MATERSGSKTRAKSPKATQTTKTSAAAEGRRRRRGRLLLAGSVMVSALVLLAWFPAGALLDQRSALSKTDSNLSQLRQQDRQLAREKALLSQPGEVARIARQDYGLVGPGQRSYEVLPPSARKGSSAYAGDPGLQPLAPPNAGAVPGDPGSGASKSGSNAQKHSGTAGTSSHQSTPTTTTTTAPPRGVWGRIVNTLEFWR
jgi:cell division protein FtsB